MGCESYLSAAVITSGIRLESLSHMTWRLLGGKIWVSTVYHGGCVAITEHRKSDSDF